MKKATAFLSILCGFLFGVIVGSLLSTKGIFNTGNITTNHYHTANSNDI